MNDDDNKPQWLRATIPSMKRRCDGHDYRSRCIYMITLVVDQRRPLLGHITGDGISQAATMHPTALGSAILAELSQITRHYPAIQIIAHQLMPDHLHFIIYVRDTISRHLSHVISSYKVGCNRLYHSACPGEASTGLWESGFHDRILKGKNHLQRMMDYIDDNPRRAAIKRHHRDYFAIQRNVQAAGLTYAALGNLFLLQAPLLLQVQCTRKLTPEVTRDAIQYYLEQARHGAVLVSPCISPGEKAVMRAAFLAGYPTIILLENGFAPLAKPGGQRFDACARGRLLLLAPWEHHNDKRRIKQSQCHALNDMAAAICSAHPQPRQPWHSHGSRRP